MFWHFEIQNPCSTRANPVNYREHAIAKGDTVEEAQNKLERSNAMRPGAKIIGHRILDEFGIHYVRGVLILQ